MRNLLLILTVGMALTLAGCAATRPAGILGPNYSPYGANLALGPSGEHAWLATGIAPRGNWPAVQTGIRMDDVTFYQTYTYDRESYFNRYGGLDHARQMVRTGVWMR